jgi:hypothetical protein
MKKATLALIVLAAMVGVIFAQTPKPKPVARSSSPAPIVEKAVWNSGWELLGITEADFRTLGFDAQSKEQATKIFSYLAANRPNFTCQKYYKDKDELKRVHVFVESAPSASVIAQEFVGQLRSKFSTIHDVSLVYSHADADVVVRALAYPNQTESNRPLGYIASVVVLTPCTFKSVSGWDKGEMTVLRMEDHELVSGGSEENVLSRLSSTLDVSDFDDVRKDHAATLKLLPN